MHVSSTCRSFKDTFRSTRAAPKPLIHGVARSTHYLVHAKSHLPCGSIFLLVNRVIIHQSFRSTRNSEKVQRKN